MKFIIFLFFPLLSFAYDFPPPVTANFKLSISVTKCPKVNETPYSCPWIYLAKDKEYTVKVAAHLPPFYEILSKEIDHNFFSASISLTERLTIPFKVYDMVIKFGYNAPGIDSSDTSEFRQIISDKMPYNANQIGGPSFNDGDYNYKMFLEIRDFNITSGNTNE